MARKRIIDTDLYFDSELCNLLGARGLLLYIRLWGIADDSGVYEPRFADIALQMGALNFKTPEVESTIQKLVDAGKVIPFTSNGVICHWLKNFIKHQPLNNPSPPKLPLPEWIYCEIKRFPSGKSYATYQILNEKLPVITGSLPIGYPSIKTKRNETKLIDAHPRCADEGQFNVFWAAYPKKRARKDALKAWVKLAPDESTIQTILAALEKQKVSEDWQKDGGRFIPYPATWLNGKRWEDEIGEVKTKGRPPSKDPSRGNGCRAEDPAAIRRREEAEAAAIPCPPDYKPEFLREDEV